MDPENYHISPDRLVQNPALAGSYNRYTYCWPARPQRSEGGNNPLSYTDPSGWEPAPIYSDPSGGVCEESWRLYDIGDFRVWWDRGPTDTDFAAYDEYREHRGEASFSAFYNARRDAQRYGITNYVLREAENRVKQAISAFMPVMSVDEAHIYLKTGILVGPVIGTWDDGRTFVYGASDEASGQEGKPGFNIDNAVNYLNEHAYPKYDIATCGKCAKAVRLSLEAGGINTSNRPNSAKDYGPYLTKWGFSTVNRTNYEPLKGDIRVFQNYEGGSFSGHIDMYNGDKWVSDYFENGDWPGAGYRKANNLTIYRW